MSLDGDTKFLLQRSGLSHVVALDCLEDILSQLGEQAEGGADARLDAQKRCWC